MCVCVSSETHLTFSGVKCVVDLTKKKKKGVQVSGYELGLNAEALIVLGARGLSVVPHVMFQLLFISHAFTLL